MKSATCCQSCQSDLPADAKFCMQCGTEAESNAANNGATSGGCTVSSAVAVDVQESRRKGPTASRHSRQSMLGSGSGQNGDSSAGPHHSKTMSTAPEDHRANVFGSKGRGLYSTALQDSGGIGHERNHSAAVTDSANRADLFDEKAVVAVADESDIAAMLGDEAESTDPSVANGTELMDQLLPHIADSVDDDSDVRLIEPAESLTGPESPIGSGLNSAPRNDVLPIKDDERSRVIAASGHKLSVKRPQTANADSRRYSSQPSPGRTAADGTRKASKQETQEEPANPLTPGVSAPTPQPSASAADFHSAQAIAQPAMVAVAVPQYIPVSQSDPRQWQSETSGAVSPLKSESKAPVQNLPNPENTGAESCNVDADTVDAEIEASTENTRKENSVVADANETELAPSAVTRKKLEDRRATALRRFHEYADAAVTELLSRQEPIPQKVPRPVAKKIRELDAAKNDQREDVTALLLLLSKLQSPNALDTLRSYAESRQPDTRVACAKGFGEVDHVGSSVALLKLLDDRSHEVVEASVNSLLRLRHPEVVRPLVAFGVAEVRYRSIFREFLQQLDDDEARDFVEPLKAELLNDEFSEHSALALHLLAVIKGAKLLKTCARLTRHKAPEMRSAAVEAMSQMGENKVVRFLNSRMKDKAPEVRAAAAAGLANVHSPKSVSLLTGALFDDAVTVRRSAARTLTGIEGEETAAAVSKALNAESDATVVEYLLEAVGRSGTDEALITLQKYLDGTDTEKRHRAINTLRRLKNKKGAKMLMPLLTDPDNDTRRLAVDAVGQLGDEAVLPILRQTISEDRQEPIRAAAARSLGELKDADSLTALEEALHDERTVRCQAIIALGRIGRKTSVPALLAQLRDQAPEVRYHACIALGEIGDLPNPEPLQDLLDDNEVMVRRAAEATLTKLGHTFKKEKWKKRIRKAVAAIVPSVVAGVLPGGLPILALATVLALGAGGYFAWNSFDFSSEPSFPVSDVRTIAVSQDGSQVSIGRKFKVLEVWDLKTGEQVVRFQSQTGADSLIYNKNGNPLVLAGTHSFELDTANVRKEGNRALTPASLENVSTFRVAVTPNGQNALLCASTGAANLVDLSSGQKKIGFKLQDFGDDASLTISPDAGMAFAGTAAGILQVISLETGKALGKLNIGELIELPGSAITAMTMDQSGSLIAIGTGNGRVVVVDINEGDVVGTPYTSKAPIRGLAFVGNTRKLHVVSAKELAKCNEDFSGAKPLMSAMAEAPECISFSADGNTVAISYSESDRFTVIDMTQDKVLVQYPQTNK